MTSGASITLADVAAAHAARPYLHDLVSDRSFTYEQFHDVALALAGRLGERGVGPGDRVAVLLPNGAELAALYFACLHAGIVVMPLHGGLGPADIAYVIRVARPKLLVCGPDTARPVPGAPATWVLDRLPSPPDHARDPARGVSTADDLFSITYTSGTTSRPKGVAHRAAAMLGAARAFNTALGYTAEHRFYHVLPMSYMAGVLNTLLCPYLAGASVTVDRAWSARSALTFWSAPREHRLDTLWLVPTMLAAIVRGDRDPTNAADARRRLRTVCSGTAPLPDAIRTGFEQKYGVEVLDSYGLSETLFVSARRPGDGASPASVGRPLDGVHVRIDDGEILVRSPFVMAGYLDPDTGSIDPRPDGAWFRTGDLGTIDGQDSLTVTGRRKDVIIRGGINISPRAVEEVVTAHPEVELAVAMGVAGGFYGEDIVVAVQLGDPVDRAGRWPGIESDLARRCRRELSPLAVPGSFRLVESLPLTSTGKVSVADAKQLVLGAPKRRQKQPAGS